jgi:hypothetical protein
MKSILWKRGGGDGRILALRRRHRPILAVRAQDAASDHFLEICMLRVVGAVFGNATSDSSWAWQVRGRRAGNPRCDFHWSQLCQKSCLEFKVPKLLNTYSWLVDVNSGNLLDFKLSQWGLFRGWNSPEAGSLLHKSSFPSQYSHCNFWIARTRTCVTLAKL